MEIKGFGDYYSYRSLGSVGRKTSGKGSSPMIGKETTEGDIVKFSPEASFRSQLSAMAKGYAAEVKENEGTVSAQRISELKAQYEGDNCPVSGYDVARAVLNRVCGPKE